MSFVSFLSVSVLVSAALAGSSSPPAVPQIQAAYERAAAQPAAKHIVGLKVVGADCQPNQDKFFCQVGYRISGDSEDRVYLDAIRMEQTSAADWKLLSGLCLR